MTEPCDLPAVATRALIGRRRLSPVELVDSCIARIEAVDHAVNAVVVRDFERARDAARAAERAVMSGSVLGPLHGLPVGIKDLENTAGLRTTYGSVLHRDHVPVQDDRSVAAIRAAGGIVLGKTNTPEWGAGANTRNLVYGATGNPFDPSRSAAGSSGGSAVALACGMVPLATGSDMGGSLRNPAAFCGVVGFRPSPGLVPDETRGQGWSPLAVLGPMARNVGDLALLLSVMAGADARDPLAATVPPDAAPLARPAPIDPSSLRVAATPDFGFAAMERVVVAAFEDKTAAMRDLFGVMEQASPDCRGTDEAFAVLRALGFLGAHADQVRAQPEPIGPNIRANVAEAARYGADDIARAFVTQTAIYRRWQDFFTRFDVLLAPAMSITPRPWTELYPSEIDGRVMASYYQWLAPAYAVSLVGHPALCLPVGRDASSMPFGLQIIGPRGGDALVLRVATALEATLAADARTARPVPDLAMLRAAPPLSGHPQFLTMG
ncbi:MAG TPA: amidase family protein [Acetobacteraceae bacterium]|nr:amidase family protein [Acetobacteraceae bacterium]